MQRFSSMLGRCFLFLLLLFFGHCTGLRQDVDTASVVNIADGDTFTLLYPNNQRVKVRLHGIDSPERAQPYGSAARKALGQLLQNHTVRIEEKDTDRYGRTVAIAYRDDGLCINEALLRDGWAWHATQYDKNPAWKKLEQEAMKKKAGLWADAKPTPPWEWRKQKRKPKPQASSR